MCEDEVVRAGIDERSKQDYHGKKRLSVVVVKNLVEEK